MIRHSIGMWAAVFIATALGVGWARAQGKGTPNKGVSASAPGQSTPGSGPSENSPGDLKNDNNAKNAKGFAPGQSNPNSSKK